MPNRGSGFRTCGTYPACHHISNKTISNNSKLIGKVNDVIPNDADNINNTTHNPNNGININDDVAVISKNNNLSFGAIAPILVILSPSGCQKSKHYAQLLTTTELIAEKRHEKTKTKTKRIY